MDRPAGADPIPEGLDWDSWLGSAPKRPYKEGIYHPGTWRGWYDFGGGSLADFCCHGFQLAYRALDLDAPTQVDSEGDALGFESFPSRCKVTFEFAAKGDRGPVKLVFYSGDNYLPPVEVTQGPVGTTGCLIVGRDGMLSAGLWNTDCNVRLRGEKEFRGMDHPAVQQVAKTEPRIDTEVLKWDPRRTAKGQRPRWSQVNNSHMFEWVLACAGDAKTYSPFEIVSPRSACWACRLCARPSGNQSVPSRQPEFSVRSVFSVVQRGNHEEHGGHGATQPISPS
jgi:hypothetical protein